MYAPGDILFFYKPTYAIDTRAEMKILKSTENAISNKTPIIVTHRLSAIKLADEIVVL